MIRPDVEGISNIVKGERSVKCENIVFAFDECRAASYIMKI